MTARRRASTPSSSRSPSPPMSPASRPPTRSRSSRPCSRRPMEEISGPRRPALRRRNQDARIAPTRGAPGASTPTTCPTPTPCSRTTPAAPSRTTPPTSTPPGRAPTAPEKRDELASLQRRLERRSDLMAKALAGANMNQLEILVAIRTGTTAFVTGKGRVPSSELVEMFLMTRCRNINCKSVLPVDDCVCKICSAKKGFCSTCMCPVCHKFDCAANTCSWVGCEATSAMLRAGSRGT